MTLPRNPCVDDRSVVLALPMVIRLDRRLVSGEPSGAQWACGGFDASVRSARESRVSNLMTPTARAAWGLLPSGRKDLAAAHPRQSLTNGYRFHNGPIGPPFEPAKPGRDGVCTEVVLFGAAWLGRRVTSGLLQWPPENHGEMPGGDVLVGLTSSSNCGRGINGFTW